MLLLALFVAIVSATFNLSSTSSTAAIAKYDSFESADNGQPSIPLGSTATGAVSQTSTSMSFSTLTMAPTPKNNTTSWRSDTSETTRNTDSSPPLSIVAHQPITTTPILIGTENLYPGGTPITVSGTAGAGPGNLT